MCSQSGPWPCPGSGRGSDFISGGDRLPGPSAREFGSGATTARQSAACISITNLSQGQIAIGKYLSIFTEESVSQASLIIGSGDGLQCWIDLEVLG